MKTYVMIKSFGFFSFVQSRNIFCHAKLSTLDPYFRACGSLRDQKKLIK